MPFQNYVCLSIHFGEIKSADGKFEAKASIVSKADDDAGIPVIVKGKDHLTMFFKSGDVKVVHGELGYNEWTKRSGEVARQLIIRASRVNNADADGRFRNFVHLTVKAGKDGEAKMSGKNGNAWATLRAFKSMGKNLSGEYRPSLWLALKAFTSKDGDESMAYNLGAIAKGQYIEVKGSLTSEVYQEQRRYGVVVRNLNAEPDLSPAASEGSNEEVDQTEAAAA